jgi:hypothetical protein
MSSVGNWRGPDIIKDGLVFYFNAASPNSFYTPSSSTLVKNIGGFSDTSSLTGSLSNGASFGTTFGGVFNFDGVDDFVNLSTFPAVNFSNGLTIEVVVRFAALGAGGWERFLDLTNLSATGSSLAFSRHSTFSNILLQSRNIAGGDSQRRYISSSNPLALNEIAIYTATMPPGSPGSPTSGTKLYKNGDLLAGAESDGTPRLPSTNIRNQGYIGRSPFGGNSFLNGSVYQLKIYNRELSAAEILKNYNGIKGIFGI